MTAADLASAFEERFGAPPEGTASAPGRVNLLGEHTDYNEGFVLPMAVGLRARVAGRRLGDSRGRLASAEFPGGIDLPLPVESPRGDWSDYPSGVWRALRSAGVPVGGFEILVSSEVPPGAGLSSSAALSVASALLLATLFGTDLPPERLALLAREAEGFAGVECGVMDPMASALGRRGSALFLDCRTLEARPVPLPPAPLAVAVCHTGVPRALVRSPYNARRRECAEAVRLLERTRPGIRALRDVSAEDLEGGGLPSPLDRRVRHVVSENERVLRARCCLEEGRLGELGPLLDASHESLARDYEVTGEALDALVRAARRAPGCRGSRMMGAGFGGCTVSLVERGGEGLFREAVEAGYYRPRGVEPRLWFFTPEEGARLEPPGGVR